MHIYIMPAPIIQYLVSSPYGDVHADTDKLDLPLECDPSKTPYRAYFQSIQNFLEQNEFNTIIKAAGEQCGREVHLREIGKIIIRAEKHGALYHPASLELMLQEQRIKFGVNVAVSVPGRNWLKKEFSTVQNLNTKYTLPYLPQVFCFEEQENASFLLEEWFEGYHEFHLSRTESGKQLINLWEFGKGYAYLSEEQSFELYRQASKILTLYYDMHNFCQIYPWHHAAGDFIVQMKDGEIDVRLTTARQYDPYMVFHETEDMNPVIAFFYFFLNLTLKMRLDKLDGVGDTVWADDFCLDASVKGFFDGLRLKDGLEDCFGSEENCFDILKSFRGEDIKIAYGPLVAMYEGSADYSIITAHLDRHAEALYATLQNCLS
jgi:hypothetical protein